MEAERARAHPGASPWTCGPVDEGSSSLATRARMRSLGTRRTLRIGGAAAGTLRSAGAARGEARVGKNILIFSDGTGQAGGYMPDEARSNVYKLFRATRVGPESIIDPELQLAFYDGGLGSRAREAIKITPLRRVYNLLSRATGLGITQNIIDCYAHIIRVWQPGDRIYLFGFSRGAYTVRCVGGVLKYCGIPTAVREKGGGVRPLQRDAKSARRIADGSGETRLPAWRLDQGRSPAARAGAACRKVPAQVFLRRRQGLQHGALLHRRVGDGADAGGGNAGAHDARAHLRGLCATRRSPRPKLVGGGFWLPFLLLGVGLPAAIYAAACMRYKGLVSLHRYRQAFYDTRLNHAVRYARHALAIDENRASFACVPWDEERPRQSFTDQPNVAAALPAGVVRRQPFRRRRQLSRDGGAALRHRAGVDGAGGAEPAASDSHRSIRAQAVPGPCGTAARRARGLHGGLARLAGATCACGSTTGASSAGARGIERSPPTRCCTLRCSRGWRCRVSWITGISCPIARTRCASIGRSGTSGKRTLRRPAGRGRRALPQSLGAASSRTGAARGAERRRAALTPRRSRRCGP